MGSPRPVLARGNPYMAQPMVQCNINGAMRYHDFVISPITAQSVPGTVVKPPQCWTASEIP